ncbi:MAG TPA: HAMP domain-containing sensor histidine kinase, partial [Chloroflexota bacterium]
APLRGPDGTVASALVVCQDIAPVKALLRSREDWVGVLARDLQEPLAAVSGLVGLLRRLLEERGLPEEAAKMLRLIATATGHLNRLVADLVDACHVDMGTLGLNKQTIDLLALLRQTVESAHEAAQGRRVRLEIVETLPPIEADADRVRQVVDTLLLAAVQHGYPDTEIRIEANRQGDEALISVTTEGPGIPPDAFAQLFTRFYRSPSARKERVPHVGLGLYISRGIVEAHGGRIWAESTPQERTTFRFTLPIAPSPEGGEAVAPAD